MPPKTPRLKALQQLDIRLGLALIGRSRPWGGTLELTPNTMVVVEVSPDTLMSLNVGLAGLDASYPVVSRNSITTECADFQTVGRGGLRAISNRAPRFRTVRLRQ
jgi:hypothetical protein